MAAPVDTPTGSRKAPEEPWRILRWRSRHPAFREDLGHGVKLTLMRIPAGSFLMGAPQNEEGSGDSERPVHRAELKEFLMGQTPVTQAQWRQVAGWSPPTGKGSWEGELEPDPVSQLRDAELFRGDQRPVVNVNWHDATEFCRRLRAHTGKNYRLPSEAQWEYACRAGTTTAFHFGEMITTDLANYNGSSTFGDGPKGENRRQTTEVGVFPANDWGLHDMHGNVWEWCADHWHDSYERGDRKAPEDGSAWIDEGVHPGLPRLLRGGSLCNYPGNCRSAYRHSHGPHDSDHYVGFRVCCLPQDQLLDP